MEDQSVTLPDGDIVRVGNFRKDGSKVYLLVEDVFACNNDDCSSTIIFDQQELKAFVQMLQEYIIE